MVLLCIGFTAKQTNYGLWIVTLYSGQKNDTISEISGVIKCTVYNNKYRATILL